MPGRGRRVAARQSQLGQRRRRQNKNGSPSPTLKSTIESTDIESATAVDQTVPSRESAVVSPARAPESLQRTSGRPASTALAHNYVKAELVKISIMGSIVIAALVGLSFLI
ncbi:MAG: hypothetical protein CL788_03305 [Chloroflexi bacterium]|jgi:hypothetical protein|nr:hypothetical protein [Chloroflexota bacterium]GIS82754.1 MAG: hypothetical protein CM1200mP15_13860 [Dehalococcoidia bacterium]